MSPPSQQDVEDALRDIDQLTSRIGNQTSGQQTRNVNGTDIDILPAKHGNMQYSVQASTEWPFVILETSFRVDEALAAERAQVRADGGVQQSGTPTQPEITQARQDLRDGAVDDIGVIRREVAKSLSQGPMVYTPRNDDDLLVGFKLERKLYPYDTTITVDEYSDVVQTMMSAHYRGREELIQRYSVRKSITDQSGPRGYY